MKLKFQYWVSLGRFPAIINDVKVNVAMDQAKFAMPTQGKKP